MYESVDAAHRLWIKGQHFSVARLMGPGYDSQDHWRHAALAINRHVATAAAMGLLAAWCAACAHAAAGT